MERRNRKFTMFGVCHTAFSFHWTPFHYQQQDSSCYLTVWTFHEVVCAIEIFQLVLMCIFFLFGKDALCVWTFALYGAKSTVHKLPAVQVPPTTHTHPVRYILPNSASSNTVCVFFPYGGRPVWSKTYPQLRYDSPSALCFVWSVLPVPSAFIKCTEMQRRA